MDDFNAMPKASKYGFLMGLAVNRLSSVGTPTGAAPPAVPMEIRRPVTGSTPGRLSLLSGSPSSLGTKIETLMNSLWNFGSTRWGSACPTSVVPR
jgi:hypothetical protein